MEDNEVAIQDEAVPAAATEQAPDAFENVELEEQPVLDEEKPVEETPVVETKAEKALRLKELRKADDSLDEDAIERMRDEHQKGSSALEEFRDLYASDPAVKAAWLKRIIAKGYTPNDEEKSFLDSQAKPAKEAPVTPQVVRAFITKHMRAGELSLKEQGYAYNADKKIMLNGDGEPITTLVELMEWREEMKDRHIDQPARAAAEKEQKDATEARQKTESQQQETAQLKAEFAEASTAFKDLFVADPKAPNGFWVTNKEVNAEMQKWARKGFGGTLTELAEFALFKLKKLQPEGVTAAKATTKTPIQNIKVVPKKAKLPDYMEEVELES